MLQLKGITKIYKTAGQDVQALKGIDLRFRANEFVSILGSSGCGKTTLLNIIGGLDHYTDGDLVINGVSTKHYNDHDWDVYRNHRIGFIFQSYNLIPHQTVLGNVELALTISGISKAERRKRAEEALRKVGLGNELYKRPNQLSGGQMQRVAIARALVNNPEILLADEPTGALDTATSVQIMDLIREIAGERLVIMVTHNPELAERYSSRIVRLQDGLVVSDTAPYVLEEESELPQTDSADKCDEKQRKAEAKRKRKEEKKRNEKSSMSFKTSLELSARNLLTKKGRTAVTSIAGSIGIISVCLVLALSSGFNAYILRTQEDMLSYYPVEITETTLDTTAIMSGMKSSKDMPDLSQLDNKVYVNSFLTNIAQGMTVNNDLSDEYVAYLESMDSSLYTAIQYDYGFAMTNNLFTEIVTGTEESDKTTRYMSLSSLKEFYKAEISNQDAKYAQLTYLVDYLGAIYGKMPGTTDFDDSRYGQYVLSQYDVLAGSFPKSSNEAVLVVGGNNDATDLLLAQLGFIDESDFLALFEKGESKDEEPMLIDFDTILSKKFVLYDNDAVYTKADKNAAYEYDYNGERKNLTVDGDGVEIKISGILRLKDGLNYGCLSSGLNVTEKLVTEYIARNKDCKIAQSISVNDPALGGQMVPYAKPVAKTLDDYFYYYEELGVYVGYNTTGALREIGASDSISSIKLYTDTFDAKEGLLAHLDAWNARYAENDERAVSYTDMVGVMMSMVQVMLNAITYVLVAFTAISLVVSSVMIGIITFVSVVERTKEIGVLRSIGARKRDIKNLFNAETFIIGLTSGVFGVAVTYLLSIAINAILGSLTGIYTLAALPFGSALIMVAVSVCLTLISGLIPANAAAKKDPVIALRTE